MEDMVEALVLAVEHRKDLPPVTTLLIGEPDTLSYDELQRAISRRLHGKEWKTYRIPKALAKFGCLAPERVARRPAHSSSRG